MGAPAAVLAVANSRAGRRAVLLALAGIALLLAIVIGPLIAVPLLLAGAPTVAAPPDSGTRPAVSGEWGRPYAGAYWRGRGYGWHPVAGCAYCPSQHYGVDMSQGCGSPIHATGPGVVTRAGSLGQFGNTVVIDHADGLQTLYAHLSWGSITVTPGDAVTAGVVLGTEGETGLSYGCHLHFEVRIHGARVDPDPFMADLGLPLT